MLTEFTQFTGGYALPMQAWSWPGPWTTLLSAVVTVLACGAAGWCFYRLRQKQESLDKIQRNLNRLAAGVEEDLEQLQLEDRFGQLAHGWNQLVEEIGDIRSQLEDRQLQNNAQETVERYQMQWVMELLGQMPFGLVTVNEDWAITYANAVAARMLGVSADNLPGRNMAEFVEQELPRLHHLEGRTIDQNCEATLTDSAFRLTSVHCTGEGNSQETAVFLCDISAQREMEHSRSQFFYHVTHELRTPLTNIRAYAETLSEGVLNDPDVLRECYNVIVGETHRLSRLVEDILSLSQLEVGSMRLSMDDVNTARLIRQVVEDMQANADEKGVDLILSLPAKVPTIRGDKEKMAVVLTNLVGNAIKYTLQGGTVEVSCLEDGGRLHINVCDTGIGIDESEQEKVFEKFYRSESEEVNEQLGTGLGLALALEIARAHGGNIELESEMGKGSTFTVDMPIESLAAVQT